MLKIGTLGKFYDLISVEVSSILFKNHSDRCLIWGHL